MKSVIMRLTDAGVLAALALTGAACGTASSEHASRMPSQDQDVFLASASVALPAPGLTVAQLPDPGAEGAALLGEYCVACHALPTPRLHAPADWPLVARRMWLRIDGLPSGFSVPVPGPGERGIMLRYLMTNGLATSTVSLPPGPGRELFVLACSKCHELPDPTRRPDPDWGVVVQRMVEFLENTVEVAVSPAERDSIVRYLEALSSGSGAE